MEPISITVGVTIAIGVVAGVIIITTFFVTRYVYKSKERRATQRAESYRQQYEKEIKVRDGLCQVAEQAGIDMQTLIDLSQKHQEKFQHALRNLVRTIHESTKTTEKLNQVAHAIHTVTEQANHHMEQLPEKFKNMQEELRAMHDKLSKTEQALANREQELQETITRLQSAEQVMTEHAKQQDTIQSFLEQSTFVCESLDQATKMPSEDLLGLRQENQQLYSKIKQLNDIISQLSGKLTQSNTKHEKSIHTIKSLLQKNAQLICKIEDLTNDLESQKAAYQPRLFKL